MLPRQTAKFSAFLLASHGFHEALDKLSAVSRENEDSPVQLDVLVGAFESRLREFFEVGSTNDTVMAAKALAESLASFSATARSMNASVGKIWEQYATDIANRARSWDYRAHIEEIHDLARKAASAFFAGCSTLKGRLATNCQLNLEVEERDSGKPRMTFTPSTQVIGALFPFDGKDHFNWYLALPFHFVHEYTAHIFAIDAKFQSFSDGWMIAAAFQFLNDSFALKKPPLGLSEEQVYVFEKTLVQHLWKQKIPAEGMRLAKIVHSALAASGRPKTFFELTHALCSFQSTDDTLNRTLFLAQFWRNLRRLVERDNAEVVKLLAGGVDRFVREVQAGRHI